MDEAPYIIKLALGLSGAISCFQIFKYLIERMPVTPLMNKLAQMGGGNDWGVCFTSHFVRIPFAEVRQF